MNSLGALLALIAVTLALPVGVLWIVALLVWLITSAARRIFWLTFEEV
jgi:hypothetical protein